MRRVTVMSRQQAENCVAMDGPIISIRNSGTQISNLMEFPAVYAFACDDITYAQEGLTLFGEKHANFIKTTMGLIEDCENVYVHCEAGISRSVAVGVYIAEVQNRTLVLAAASSTIGANQHILNMLRRQDKEKELNEAFRA